MAGWAFGPNGETMVKFYVMLVFPRLSHHSNTGKLTHHRETSYALLTFLTLVVGVLLASYSASAKAASCGVPATPNCSGTYSVTAVVGGPRPTKPVIITSPSNGQTFNANPVTVEGTCPTKALVKIFKNGVLAGSVICGPSGRFSLPIDLVIGRNDLTALGFNALDQEGPTSPTVTVTLNQPAGGPGFSTELVIQSENYYRGTLPGDEVVWPVELVGGQAPYAVIIDWGDGTSDLITRLAPGGFTVKHIYKRTGGYLGSFPLIIRATDAVGHTAYLQLTTLVNSGKAGAPGATTPPVTQVTTMFPFIWPLWVLLLFMIISFWLGERREKRIMQRQFEAVA